MSLLKLLGVLLDYPRDELWEHRQELVAAISAVGLAEAQQAELAGFIQTLLDTDPMSAQDQWLATFDRGRAMSLLLFEHIYGESRDRGQAMVDLVETYRRHGFELAARELPDYLPLVLEYLSHRSSEEARDWLQNISHIVGLLEDRATDRQSPYAALFRLLTAQTDSHAHLQAERRPMRHEIRDDTPEAMDRLWEEEVVRFSAQAPDDSCSPGATPPRHSEAFHRVQP